MDNVLVNFQSGIDKITQNEQLKFQDRLDEVPNIFSKMTPVDGAIDAFNELSKLFDTYILSTAPWENPSAWSDKLLWVKKYIPGVAKKKLILTHNKNLNNGDFLVDDRTANGAGKFGGELIQYGTEKFPTAQSIKTYLNV